MKGKTVKPCSAYERPDQEKFLGHCMSKEMAVFENDQYVALEEVSLDKKEMYALRLMK